MIINAILFFWHLYGRGMVAVKPLQKSFPSFFSLCRCVWVRHAVMFDLDLLTKPASYSCVYVCVRAHPPSLGHHHSVMGRIPTHLRLICMHLLCEHRSPAGLLRSRPPSPSPQPSGAFRTTWYRSWVMLGADVCFAVQANRGCDAICFWTSEIWAIWEAYWLGLSFQFQ